MQIIDQLASSLNRRDEEPNMALATAIAAKDDHPAVQELVDLLQHKSKNIQSDAIKVIYEIAAVKPALVSGYAREIIALLDHKNNRLQWGAMTTLNAITAENPALVYAALPKIVEVADQGSVITRDHCVGILIQLCRITEYTDDAFHLLIAQLQICPTNQLPMYAENAAPVIKSDHRHLFVETLTSRLDEIEKDTKRKRVEKVIKKFNP